MYWARCSDYDDLLPETWGAPASLHRSLRDLQRRILDVTILWNASCAHRRYMRLVEDGRGPAIVNCSPELWAAILTEANFRLGRVPEPLPDGRITFTMNRGELAVTLDCAREMENTNLYAAIVRAVESGAWPLVVNVSH